MKIVVLLSGLVLWVAAMAAPAAADHALDVRILRGNRAGSNVVIQAFIDRDDRNRAVEFLIDSEGYSARSMQNLDGEHAPRIKEVRFQQLPAGAYAVRVKLWGPSGVRGGLDKAFDLW